MQKLYILKLKFHLKALKYLQDSQIFFVECAIQRLSGKSIVDDDDGDDKDDDNGKDDDGDDKDDDHGINDDDSFDVSDDSVEIDGDNEKFYQGVWFLTLSIISSVLMRALSGGLPCA